MARQIRLIKLAQRQFMICPATKLGRQRERATNVSLGVNAASTRLLSYGIATMLQGGCVAYVYACITVNEDNVFIKILILRHN